MDILRDAHDLAFPGEVLVDFAAVSLINSNGASFLFVVQLCLFNECCNQVFNCAVLGDKDIKRFLYYISNCSK
jgi:hypothetical protein